MNKLRNIAIKTSRTKLFPMENSVSYIRHKKYIEINAHHGSNCVACTLRIDTHRDSHTHIWKETGSPFNSSRVSRYNQKSWKGPGKNLL